MADDDELTDDEEDEEFEEEEEAPEPPPPLGVVEGGVAVGLLALLAVLNFLWLDLEGYGNLYYAAAVKSMLLNGHNFFFAAFDPTGFVSVDKPPLGLWIQVLSARLLGYSGWNLLWPQALAGVASGVVLYLVLRRVFGRLAAGLAALTLALTPISVAANRNNTMDSLLVFTSLLAAWAGSLAADRGKLRWLLVCALCVGIGFNIKMLQAMLVLPALFGVYLLAARVPWLTRLWHLAVATLVLAAVSMWWPWVVDLTPAAQRPYVGSSQNNTVMELVLGHNGVARLGQLAGLAGLVARPSLTPTPTTANTQPPASTQTPGATPLAGATPLPGATLLPGNVPGGYAAPGLGPVQEVGMPGVGRLFSKELGGQLSWLLPLAVLGAVAAALGSRWRPWSARARAVVLWSLWVVPQVVFFSIAGLFHRYYLAMLAPGVAALVGAGVAGMWQDYGEEGWRGWGLPVALGVTTLVEALLLLYYPTWALWLAPMGTGLTALGVAGLVALRARELTGSRWAVVSLAGGLVGVLLAPAVWAITPVWFGGDTALPYAGPDLAGPHQSGTVPEMRRLEAFLRLYHWNERYDLVALNANTAAPLIITSDLPVIALGGFSGADNILSVAAVAQKVQAGEMRFFMLPAPGAAQPVNAAAPPAAADQQAGVLRWVVEHCAMVPRTQWQIEPRLAPGGGLPQGLPGEVPQLFDCRPRPQ